MQFRERLSGMASEMTGSTSSDYAGDDLGGIRVLGEAAPKAMASEAAHAQGIFRSVTQAASQVAESARSHF